MQLKYFDNGKKREAPSSIILRLMDSSLLLRFFIFISSLLNQTDVLALLRSRLPFTAIAQTDNVDRRHCVACIK